VVPPAGPPPGPQPAPHAAVDRSHPRARRATRRDAGGVAMIDVAPFTAHWEVALPGIIVAATALVVMAVDALARGSDREVLAGLGIAGVAAAGVAAISLRRDGPVVGFGGTLRAHGARLFVTP